MQCRLLPGQRPVTIEPDVPLGERLYLLIEFVS